MEIDAILDSWSTDSQIDQLQLGYESINTAKLHSKYLQMYVEQKLLLMKRLQDAKILYRLKREYYLGQLSKQELDDNNWSQFQKVLLKTEIPIYIDADVDIIKSNLKISLQQEKVDTLEQILKMINKRDFAIKNAIDDQKFKAGN